MMGLLFHALPAGPAARWGLAASAVLALAAAGISLLRSPGRGAATAPSIGA
jgi:hypothetical protein